MMLNIFHFANKGIETIREGLKFSYHMKENLIYIVLIGNLLNGFL
jgi:hypothetical protein